MGAVTLRAVGERAGVSRQAPYKHFVDKSALLSVVAAGYFGRLGRRDGGGRGGGGRGSPRAPAGDGRSLRAVRAGQPAPVSSDVRGEDAEVVHSRGARGGPRPLRAVRRGRRGLPAGRASCRRGTRSELAALIYATGHGAVDLALAGQAEASKGLEDPRVAVPICCSSTSGSGGRLKRNLAMGYRFQQGSGRGLRANTVLALCYESA